MSCWSSIPNPIITIDINCAGAVHIDTMMVRMIDFGALSRVDDAIAPTAAVCSTITNRMYHLW